ETEIASVADASVETEVAPGADASGETEVAPEAVAAVEEEVAPEAVAAVETEVAPVADAAVETEATDEPEQLVESNVDATGNETKANEVADLAETVEANVEEIREPKATEATVATVATDASENVASAIRENEFWILGQNGSGFYFYRLQDGAWNASNADEFYANGEEFAVVVYAHGYQTDMNDATRDAVAFKAVLDAARRNVGAERPFRLVVWKWNSERDAARIRIDAQAKATLADQSGKALGRCLGGLGPNADLALVGFSFGARVVGSALETLAQSGAQASAFDVEFNENEEFAFAVSGKLVADAAENVADAETPSVQNDANAEKEEGRKIALILVAAACDLGSFEARGVYGRGAALPTDVLNVYNPNDFALKYYRYVSETRSDAQGVAPIRAGLFPNAVGKTFNVNSNPALGKRHSFVDAIGIVPTQTLGDLAF
ncbi:MAG: alpha/beta hydrolase, partial [Thermoguttaceae bacterium]|nr:alpha/beta hydrolase [Thermoguttaceae bacterium]